MRDKYRRRWVYTQVFTALTTHQRLQLPEQFYHAWITKSGRKVTPQESQRRIRRESKFYRDKKGYECDIVDIIPMFKAYLISPRGDKWAVIQIERSSVLMANPTTKVKHWIDFITLFRAMRLGWNWLCDYEHQEILHKLQGRFTY
jgi:hypothetical protein